MSGRMADSERSGCEAAGVHGEVMDSQVLPHDITKWIHAFGSRTKNIITVKSGYVSPTEFHTFHSSLQEVRVRAGEVINLNA